MIGVPRDLAGRTAAYCVQHVRVAGIFLQDRVVPCMASRVAMAIAPATIEHAEKACSQITMWLV